MLKVKMNHKNDVNDIKCQLCSKHDGTTKHVMVCERENSGKQYQIMEQQKMNGWKYWKYMEKMKNGEI